MGDNSYSIWVPTNRNSSAQWYDFQIIVRKNSKNSAVQAFTTYLYNGEKSQSLVHNRYAGLLHHFCVLTLRVLANDLEGANLKRIISKIFNISSYKEFRVGKSTANFYTQGVSQQEYFIQRGITLWSFLMQANKRKMLYILYLLVPDIRLQLLLDFVHSVQHFRNMHRKYRVSCKNES